MNKLFGTDGERGIAVTDLTCELAMKIGRAAAVTIAGGEERHSRIIIGTDTRSSSDPLEDAVVSGVRSVGTDAEVLGVVPTSVVAYMTEKHDADAGIMISGSGSSAEFNGIKIFGHKGRMLTDDEESEIENLVLYEHHNIKLAPHDEAGRISYYNQAADDYIEYIREIAECDLSGMKIALDCANGCASVTAQKLFSSFGAEIFVMSDTPDGENINRNCGTNQIDPLIYFMKKNSCDCAFAFDGDADRCTAVDENGEIVDGERIFAILLEKYSRDGLLKDNTAVITAMANSGLRKFASDKGITLVNAGAGHRYILERMTENGYNLGGEPNGHIVFLDDLPTADGQLTALRILGIMKKENKKLSQLAADMTKLPQVMLNVRIDTQCREMWKNNKEISQMIESFENELGENGRIVVRESGHEPLIRIMTEGSDFSRINEMAMALEDCIRRLFRHRAAKEQ